MKVMFVDDEAQVLRGLRRSLEDMFEEEDWQMNFATSAPEALEAMKTESFNILVSDMRMPGMDGAELLEHTSRLHPETIRIVLSGQANKESVLRAVSPMHQYLSKPCDTEELRSVIFRALSYRGGISTIELGQLIGSVRILPAKKESYEGIVRELNSAGGSISVVGKIISLDPAMSAKILQIANSAAFGVSQQISSAQKAVSLLGIDTLRSLALSVRVFRPFEQIESTSFPFDGYWNRAQLVATFARKIAEQESDNPEVADEAFSAGMLHNIGPLLIAMASPEKTARIEAILSAERVSCREAEQRVLGTDHSHLGARLLSLWGLPLPIIDAIRFRETIESGPEYFSAATAVAAACVIANEVGTDNTGVGDDDRLGVEQHLARIGLVGRLPDWRTTCLKRVAIPYRQIKQMRADH